jgi:hypothetical protein
MLIGRGFLLVSALPFLQIPNLETASVADESHLALQTQLAANVLRENQATLLIGSAMFGAGMELTQKRPAIAGRKRGVRFGLGAHAGELLFRHDEEKRVLRMRQENELFALTPPPAKWYGDPVFLVERMAEFAGEEFLGLRVVFHTPADKSAISIHFPPLLTTFRTRGQYKLMAVAPFFPLVNSLMLAGRSVIAIAFAVSVFAANLRAQTPSPLPDAIRVTVSINADGTRTTYEFDPPNHRATATTTSKDGNTIGKVRYVLDDAGRFASGDVYGPNEQFRFKTLYKYDAAGKLTQETQLGADDAVRNKIVYAYDKNGRQTGYTVYDAAGKLVRRTPEVGPSRPPSPAKRK